MSIYEKKYKEALELARDYYKANLKLHKADENAILEDIFPELNENEDEKNIKGLIDELKCSLRAANCQNDACGGGHEKRIALLEWGLAWLEKQGEQKYDDYENATIRQKDFASKSERKFKIGDWIVKKDGELFVGGSKFAQITDIDKELYWLNCGTWLEDKDIRLWTIQDAKAGDVLTINNDPFIYNGKISSDRKRCGGFYGITLNQVALIDSECDWTEIDGVFPATKEQRDLLFKKTNEAGYEWDEEKKELKKIEQNSADESSAFKDKLLELFQKFRYIKEGMPTNGDIIDYVDTHIQELIDTIQKSAWSEDDKDFMYDTLSNLTELKNRYGEGYGNVGKCIDWLKSLKGRMLC